MGIKNFFKKAFSDIKESARAQHDVDKANFKAVKAESKAQWEEAKASSEKRAEREKQLREKQIADAKARTEVAQQRIDKAKNNR